MPTFCRHNRFIERCPICSRDLEEPKPQRRASTARRTAATPTPSRSKQTGTVQRLRVRRELRSEDDGYRSPLLAGLRSSKDAARLAEEIAFAAGRLAWLETDPPGVYAELRTQPDVEQASWMCFLLIYISPLQGEDPFAGARLAIEQAGDWHSGALPDLEEIPLGPRTSHEPGRGTQTFDAYRRWAEQASSQEAAFSGEPSWSAQRRFERVFERLAFPGFGRGGRFDLLLVLGAVGLYELEADSLHFGGAQGRSTEDPTTIAAKRIFAIGDPLNLERRSHALAQALEIPLGALDLAFCNWSSSERMTLGFADEVSDPEVLERSQAVLGL